LRVSWKGHDHNEDAALVYTDRDTGRTTTVIGYLIGQLVSLRMMKNFKYVWLTGIAVIYVMMPEMSLIDR
jgi:hypothetical protein